jgi:hypothetical protein
VVDENKSECRVDWDTSFEHPSMDADAAGKLVKGIYHAGFAALKETVES